MKYFHKLNMKFPIGTFTVGDLLMETDYLKSFTLLHESEQLMELEQLLCPRRVSLVEIKPGVMMPPHFDPNLRTVMHFYIDGASMLFNFWDPMQGATARAGSSKKPCEYDLDDLIYNSSFIPEDCDCYLLDVSRIHSMRMPAASGNPSHFVQMSWEQATAQQILDMLP